MLRIGSKFLGFFVHNIYTIYLDNYARIKKYTPLGEKRVTGIFFR